MAILLVPMCLVLVYFLKKDPELLERRMRMKEKEPEQKAIIKLSYPLFLAAFLLPGFDRRFGWSTVPVWLVLVADIIVLAAYGLFFRVMHENRFLSRVVEVDQKQKVISYRSLRRGAPSHVRGGSCRCISSAPWPWDRSGP